MPPPGAEDGFGMRAATLDDLVARLRLAPPVTVTRPTLPDLDRYRSMLAEIWATAHLTNRGPFHERLEAALAERLGVKHLSLFANGTLALHAILDRLHVAGGEVVTTPFTFPATAHAIRLAGATPVFADVDPTTLNLDPAHLEAAVTERTRAILPVHVYGTPCDVEGIDDVAGPHGLPVVYDGAHAFGVTRDGRGVAGFGDATMLSFHATKCFSTVEGGALVLPDAETKRAVDLWRNFGIADETTVVDIGTNAKMNELQAAFGLLQLETVDRDIETRRALAVRYGDGLASIEGLAVVPVPEDVVSNHAYVPIRVDAAAYGWARDDLDQALRRFGVVARRYFFPLVSRLPAYRELPSARPGHLPVAEAAAAEILCLPIYATLDAATVDRILEILARLHERGADEGGRS